MSEINEDVLIINEFIDMAGNTLIINQTRYMTPTIIWDGRVFREVMTLDYGPDVNTYHHYYQEVPRLGSM